VTSIDASGAAESASDSAASFDLDVSVEGLSVEAVEETTSPQLVAEDPGRVPVEFRVPVFSHATVAVPESAQRRRRRWFALATAAGVFAALVGVAVVAVQPVLLVRTSGALRPETSVSAAEAKGLPVEKAPEPAADRIATLRGSTAEASDGEPIGRVSAPVTQVVGAAEPSEEKGAPGAGERGVGRVEEHGAKASAAAAEAGFDETAASRVSLALSQPAKEHIQSPVKRPARRAAPPPRRGTRATAAKATTAPSTKVDCRQPFWVDERGIRRLKMACL
jgi:hypothetical protein